MAPPVSNRSQRWRARLAPALAWLRKQRLVHFALGGALLFAIAPAPPAGGEIHLSERQKLAIFAKRARLGSKSSLTPEEQRAALDDWLREELLYREGLRLGLDRDDTVVRRRIVQKIRFLFEDIADAAHPADDAVLRGYYEQHTDRWRSPEAVDFLHVFVSESRHGIEARQVAQELMKQLERDPKLDPMTLGDGFVEPRSKSHAPRKSVAATFGEALADKVFALPTGSYQGPFESSLGWHIIKVDKVHGGRARPFEEVRQQVIGAYREERQGEELRKRYEELTKRYPITIEDQAAYSLPSGAGLPAQAREAAR